MSLDNTNLARCSECGRLIPKKIGQTLCSKCLKEKKVEPVPEKEPIKHKIIIPPSDEKQTDLELSFETEETIDENKTKNRTCSMCGNHHALPNRNLCLNCMLDMYQGFQKAVQEISSEKKKSTPEETLRVHEAYTSTRRMEPFRRLRTQGLTWVKGYNLH